MVIKYKKVLIVIIQKDFQKLFDGKKKKESKEYTFG